MKKQKLMTAIGILFALTLAGTITVPTLYAQSDDKTAPAQNATQGGILDILEQMRRVTRRPGRVGRSGRHAARRRWPASATQPSTSAYLSFARGGVLIGFNRTLPFGSPQHGVWEHQEGHSFAFTFKQDLFDGTGSFIGTLTVRGRLTLNGKDEFVGNFSAERRDANNNLFPTGCGTIRGTRIKVEPPAEQCQNLTPPQ